MAKERAAKHRLGPQRNPAIDEAVLEATRQLLVEKGYAGVTVDAIATRAGVGRPAIYRRWPSKAHIVNDAVYPVLDTDRDADIDAELGTQGAMAEQVRDLVYGAVALFGAPATRAAAPGLMNEVRSDESLRGVLIERQLAGVRTELARRLDDAIARGEIRAGVDADTLLDILAGTAIFALSLRDVEDAESVAAALTDIVLHGILPEPGR
ncbi:TetR/AcrR family transcriptional regulator [Rhodococcus sp. NPDC127528]|uniref:TetR/AcrR family transcriptional regulator n=1 Tax=unclassified Rhodococcus (in: high G+C Gram-positive bacteria) TaxID=192944 RepID=UPI0036275FD2